MIPVVCTVAEINDQIVIIKKVHEEINKKFGKKVPLLIGTMIEIPRAALVAGKIAESAEFFSLLEPTTLLR